MSKEKLPVEKLINKWKVEHFVDKMSEKGTPYKILPNSCRMECLTILAKTLFDHGYSYDDMDKSDVSLKIANVCWRSDKIVKMSGPEIAKAKYSIALDWQEVIDGKYLDIEISKLEDHEKPVFKEEPKVQSKPLEIDPSDRIKMDTSDIEEPELDSDFLSELGVDESFISGKKDE